MMLASNQSLSPPPFGVLQRPCHTPRAFEFILLQTDFRFFSAIPIDLGFPPKSQLLSQVLLTFKYLITCDDSLKGDPGT